MGETKNNNIQAAIDAGKALGSLMGNLVYPDPETPGLAFVPQGYVVHQYDFEKYRSAPRRTQQKTRSRDLSSFVDYVNLFKTASTRIFSTMEPQTFVAAIDYHTPTEASWCDHRAYFTPVASLEYSSWKDSSGKKMSQAEFASFLEDNYSDIVEPDAATMLGLALTFEATTAAEFRSGIRLDNGQVQFQYVESIKTGAVEVPTSFKIGIPIHQDGPRYQITCRLKYRLEGGKLSFLYEMVHVEKYVRDTFAEMREEIKEATGMEPLAVWPEGF